jgi:hypothetical protein
VKAIKPHDALGLHEVLAIMDQWSAVTQFPWGRYAGVLGPDLITDVLVVKSWHQENNPHITVRLRFVRLST